MGIAVVTERGPSPADRILKDQPDRRGESFAFGSVERSGRPNRGQAGVKEALVGVDVSEPRQDRLVEQRDLQGPCGRPEGFREQFGQPGGRSAQGVGPEPAVAIQIERRGVGKHQQIAKPPWIGVAEMEPPPGAGQRPSDVFVGKGNRSDGRGLDPHAAGHSQPHPKGRAGVGCDDRDLLAVTPQANDHRTRERRGASRQCVRSVLETRSLDEGASTNANRLDPCRDQHGFERSTKAFDLGKFRHRSEDAREGHADRAFYTRPTPASEA